MPKVKTISRNEKDYTRERKSDRLKVFRNFDPKLHPFEKRREYTRALNAVKLDRIFAKPFLYALSDHRDGIWSMCTLPTTLLTFISGSADGEIRVWNLSTRKCLWHTQAHSRFVRGICSDNLGEKILTCSDDKTIKIWDIDQSNALENQENITPTTQVLGKNNFTGIDHHRSQNMFATSGVQVDLWDKSRGDPIHSFEWGAESVNTVKFNLVETNVLGATSSDSKVILYDVREKSSMKKLVLTNNSNGFCWNPQEAYHFTVANDDMSVYTFDMRHLKRAQIVHLGHTKAVMCVDYSPDGQEIATGSFDRTIRIFSAVGNTGIHSREIYHTKRMNRIWSVKFSADNTYLLSGSSDTNIRVWKVNSSKRLQVLIPKEETKQQYYDKLKDKFKNMPEIRRIAQHRHVPRRIKGQQLRIDGAREAEKRHFDNIAFYRGKRKAKKIMGDMNLKSKKIQRIEN